MEKPELKYFIASIILVVAVLGVSYHLVANGVTITQPQQGGTGIATTTVGNVGKCLQVSSSSPLGYTFGTCAAAAVTATTTIYSNATSSGPSFVFTTSTGSNWLISAVNNVINFQLPSNVSFFTNDAGYRSTSTVSSVTQNLTLIGGVLNTNQNIMPTSSPSFASTTLSGQLNLGTVIAMSSSSQPTVTNDGKLYLHNFVNSGIPRLENDTPFTTNGCDVVNRDNCVIVKNNTGTSTTIGQAVYVNGASGTNPTVTFAQANSSSTAAALGLTASTTVANNGFFFVMIKGILSNVDTSAFSAGDILYVSPTIAGGLTNVRPTVPNVVTRIGTVLVSNANTGQILVEVAPAVLGKESGTINSTFNINGQLALTSSTAVTSVNNAQGAVTLDSSGGPITVNGTHFSVPSSTVTSIVAGTNITVSSTTDATGSHVTINSTVTGGSGTSFWQNSSTTLSITGSSTLEVADTGNSSHMDKIFGRGTVIKWLDGSTTRLAMIASSTYNNNVATSSIIGDVFNGGIATSTLKYGMVKASEITMAMAGTLATSTDSFGHYFVSQDLAIFGADVHLGTVGTGASTLFQIYNSSSTVMINPSIATAVSSSTYNAATNATTITAGNFITANVSSTPNSPAIDAYLNIHAYPLNYQYLQ